MPQNTNDEPLPAGLVRFKNNFNGHVVTLTVEQAKEGVRRGTGVIVDSEQDLSRANSRNLSPREAAMVDANVQRVYSSISTATLKAVEYRLRNLPGQVSTADLVATLLTAFGEGKVSLDMVEIVRSY